jgi:Helix-turn-helix domain
MRDKLFGYGRCVPLDRNGKARVMTLARALMRRTEPGKAYGAVTAKALAVLGALLYGFHNAGTGRCFPSYEAIADRAGCCRATVYIAIRALEAAKILTWDNRIVRVRERCDGLFGEGSATRVRVIRTSNAYRFNDPSPSKSNLPTGTTTQVNLPLLRRASGQAGNGQARVGAGAAYRYDFGPIAATKPQKPA